MKDVACVLLAAGMSSRMGEPKLLMRAGGKTIFEITLESHLESSVSSICAVVPGWLPGFKEIAETNAGERVEFVEMPGHCPMSDSLKSGWRRLQESAGPGAVMISLADKPLIATGTIDTLIDAWGRTGKPVCVPVYRGMWGHPVIISSRLDSEIMKLEGDQGAREVLERYRGEAEQVEIDSDEVLVDVDSAEDLDTLRSRLEADE